MKKFDKSQLMPERFVKSQRMHRDVLAHHLRWTHLARHWQHWKVVFDVGCGRGCPLAWALYTNRVAPELYVGLDIRSFVPNAQRDDKAYPQSVTNWLRKEGEIPDKDWMCVWDRTSIVNFFTAQNVQQTYGPADVVVCFELLEHMSKELGIELLKCLHTLCLTYKDREPVDLFLSTPVFNGRKAKHHIYEWEYVELEDELLRQGFIVINSWGTFASQRDILPAMSHPEIKLFYKLKDYYSSDVLSILFAPLHAPQSRNVLWHLQKRR